VLTLTDQAVAAIRNLTSRPRLPAQTGLRIAPQDGGTARRGHLPKARLARAAVS